MTISPFVALFKPTGSAKLSRGTLGYVCARARQRAYDLLVSEFRKSGLSQADLASRLGKAPELICRWLNRPSNLELDTLSATVFAINGGVLTFGVSHPVRNRIEVSLPPPDIKLAQNSAKTGSSYVRELLVA
jgi:hypothetical protein